MQGRLFMIYNLEKVVKKNEIIIYFVLNSNLESCTNHVDRFLANISWIPDADEYKLMYSFIYYGFSAFLDLEL